MEAGWVSSGSSSGTEDCLRTAWLGYVPYIRLRNQAEAEGLALEIAVVAGNSSSTEDCLKQVMFRTLDYEIKQQQQGWHWRQQW